MSVWGKINLNRKIGIPTVRDRVVQQVLKNMLEPLLNLCNLWFHPPRFDGLGFYAMDKIKKGELSQINQR
ncbi:MAG: hypothetical protein PHS63_05025 [Desulfoplanes sp.]|nr:hypothetical protein [Desulfoplanes sp.]